MQKIRTYSCYSTDVATILSKQIKLARKQHKWTEADVAERAGVSLSTIKRIEKGDMTCAIGLVLEVATLVGVRLFGDDSVARTTLKERIDDKIALLPKTIRNVQKKVDDDF